MKAFHVARDKAFEARTSIMQCPVSRITVHRTPSTWSPRRSTGQQRLHQLMTVCKMLQMSRQQPGGCSRPFHPRPSQTPCMPASGLPSQRRRRRWRPGQQLHVLWAPGLTRKGTCSATMAGWVQAALCFTKSHKVMFRLATRTPCRCCPCFDWGWLQAARVHHIASEAVINALLHTKLFAPENG